MSTYLKDLIHIPESVHKSDFVISLADGITNPKEVVEQYVVTDQLVGCFQEALDLISTTVKDNRSKAAYLHGSFGSGKSHFMAILHLLLQGHTQARAKPELAPVVERYDEKIGGKKFLLVPYHMVGATSLEAGVLGGYVEHIRKLHPEAPTPPVYLDDKLLEDATRLREKFGDEAFFSGLGDGDDDGFGDLGAGWTAERFEAALAAPPGSADRRALVSDYIDAYSHATPETARASGKGYVSFAEGLDLISQQAKSLEYDAVILFLDELILWFASHMSTPGFVQSEGQKIAKLVEAPSANRPAPIASLIARQRDLREFLGDGVPGADQMNFGDHLEYWESRFDKITLSDTNLRAIVEKRLLQPRSEEARAKLHAGFSELASQAGTALDTLTTSDADRKAFERVYPFSPAMIETLIAVSSYLQRERTALRLLSELLSDKAADLEVGDLIPLGDLYDVIRDGEEPFSAELRKHFDSARQLYDRKLRPLLLATHGLDSPDALASLDGKHPARAQDRIIKTLLIGALVPDAAPLRNLTVRRLTDLNYGTIRTPIPGHEATVVLEFLRGLATDVPEVQISGDDQDPVVSLQLTGVDIQAILDDHKQVDSTGARRSLVRTLVQEALGIEPEPGVIAIEHRFVWRGTRRQADVRFGNVRDPAELPDAEFRANPGRPRVIIDYPFDESGFGPSDDLARMQELLSSMDDPTNTVAWLPLFLTDEALEKLGQLTVIEHLMKGDRFDTAVQGRLSPQDRIQARSLIKNQQASLRDQVSGFLRQAYGVEAPKSQWVQEDVTQGSQFPSLDPALDVRPPTAPSMMDAFEQVLDQMMTRLYPAHPVFESRVTTGDLRKCLAQVERAVADKNGRAENIPATDRPAVRKVLGPLKIAETGEAHIALSRHWRDHFHTRIQQNPGTPMTVERLRGWIDEPKPMGLPPEIESLVIQSWALQENRVLVRAGIPVPREIGTLDATVVARTQELPEPSEWEAAGEIFNAVFGVQASPLLNAANVAKALEAAREEARKHIDDVHRVRELLEAVSNEFECGEDSARRRNAIAAAALVDRTTSESDDVKLVGFLADLEPPTSAQALGRTMKSAGEVDSTLRSMNRDLFGILRGLDEPWTHEAQEILADVREALEADEFTIPLAPKIHDATARATGLAGKLAKKKSGEAGDGSDGEETPDGAASGPDERGTTGLRRTFSGPRSRSELETHLETLEWDQVQEIELRVTLRDEPNS